jgi:hypothetical protein
MEQARHAFNHRMAALWCDFGNCLCLLRRARNYLDLLLYFVTVALQGFDADRETQGSQPKRQFLVGTIATFRYAALEFRAYLCWQID